MTRRGLPFLIIMALLVLTAGTMGVAQAQVTPYPVTLTMSGPATAVAGQVITYRVRYQLTDPATLSHTAIVISFSQGATYVSTQVISGTGGVLAPHSDHVFRWSDLGSTTETAGEIEMVVRTDGDFRGTVSIDASVPGTATTASNIVETGARRRTVAVSGRDVPPRFARNGGTLESQAERGHSTFDRPRYNSCVP